MRRSRRQQDTAIVELLSMKGKELFRARREPVPFTGLKEADSYFNNIECYPHAFVLGCIMDQQEKTERAWLAPWQIAQTLGSLEFEALERLTLRKIERLFSRPRPLHRFYPKMAVYFHAAVRRISSQYSGNAGRIWAQRPASAEVVRRFREFHGVGPKISSMAVNSLARQLKVPFSDYLAIDISPDVHVRRVLARLGLVSETATVDQVIIRARELSPDFPGLLDFAPWEIGRNWCHANTPHCADCFMRNVCPTALRGLTNRQLSAKTRTSVPSVRLQSAAPDAIPQNQEESQLDHLASQSKGTRRTYSGLLVIDVQVGIIEGFHAYRGREVLEQINGLLAKARASNTPIIYVQHDGEKGHPLEIGSEGWEIHPDINPCGDDLIIRKRAADSFFETTLQQELEARGIKDLIVTGCMTEYCVDTTSRRAVSMGYDVTLVGDAHTTIDNKLLTAAQIIAHHNALLDGFDAGSHTIAVKPADEVTF
jgi:endonuclease-3